MTLVLAVALWLGALVFFLVLVGGVRRADALRTGTVIGRLGAEIGTDLDTERSVGGRLAAPPRATRQANEADRRVVSG